MNSEHTARKYAVHESGLGTFVWGALWSLIVQAKGAGRQS